jgi:hypothetical protein
VTPPGRPGSGLHGGHLSGARAQLLTAEQRHALSLTALDDPAIGSSAEGLVHAVSMNWHPVRPRSPATADRRRAVTGGQQHRCRPRAARTGAVPQRRSGRRRPRRHRVPGRRNPRTAERSRRTGSPALGRDRAGRRRDTHGGPAAPGGERAGGNPAGHPRIGSYGVTAPGTLRARGSRCRNGSSRRRQPPERDQDRRRSRSTAGADAGRDSPRPSRAPRPAPT